MATSEPVRRSAAALLRLTCRPEVTGMDQVPAEGPFIMASNHLSFFDSVILQALAPRPVHFFAKEEYFTGAGATASKIAIGIPAYGRAFEQTTGIGAPYSGVSQSASMHY